MRVTADLQSFVRNCFQTNDTTGYGTDRNQ